MTIAVLLVFTVFLVAPQQVASQVGGQSINTLNTGGTVKVKFSVWSSWSNCSTTCGDGQKQRARICVNAATNQVLLNTHPSCTGLTTDLVSCTNPPCNVDGGWGQWSNYSSCSAQCGGSGYQWRTRLCNNPARVGSGTPCQGPSEEQRNCTTIPACSDAQWQDYLSSVCSTGCGVGVSTTQRRCHLPIPCEYTIIVCQNCTDFTRCPPNGVWTSWGPISPCLAGPGSTATTTRTRECASGVGLCDGATSSLTSSCERPPSPVDAYWSTWSAWSIQHSCGTGTKVAKRVCIPPRYNGRDCIGSDQKTETSVLAECPHAGTLSDWVVTSTSCSYDCETGFVTVERTCDNPQPLADGSPCNGAFLKSTIKCKEFCNSSRRYDHSNLCDIDPDAPPEVRELYRCPVNGGWTKWSDFSYCSVTCGTGVRVKFRRCTLPSPRSGGADCVGTDTVSEVCTVTPACSPPYSCANWNAWSSCNPPGCNVPSVRTRDQTCWRREPLGPIPGLCYQTSNKTFIIYNPQGSSNCSNCRCVDPGGICLDINGTIAQYTEGCTTLQAAFQGCCLNAVGCTYLPYSPQAKLCLPSGGVCKFIPSCWHDATTTTVYEKMYQSKSCATSCPVNGTVQWSPWSDCTKSCGPGGTRVRYNVCTAPNNANGVPCSPLIVDTSSCLVALDPCPIDGVWSQWSLWTDCIGKCGNTGKSSRYRNCTGPTNKGNLCRDWVSVSDFNGKKMKISYPAGTTASSADCRSLCAAQTYCLSYNWCSGDGTCTLLPILAVDGRLDTSIATCNHYATDGTEVLHGTQITALLSTLTGVATADACGAACTAAVSLTAPPACRSFDFERPNGTCYLYTTTALNADHASLLQWNSSFDHYEPKEVDDVQIRDCTKDMCPTLYSTWTDFTTCNSNCGVGCKTRTKICNNICNVTATDIQDCVGTSCNINGNWGTWSDWTACSATCGDGAVQNRVRNCDRPPQQGTGATCVDDGAPLQRSCSSVQCPVNGSWSNWSALPPTCPSTCKKSQSRLCNSPAPSNGGAACPGADTQSSSCTGGQCRTVG